MGGEVSLENSPSLISSAPRLLLPVLLTQATSQSPYPSPDSATSSADLLRTPPLCNTGSCSC